MPPGFLTREGNGVGDRTRPVAIDLDGDGTLQQADGNYETVDFIRISDDTFETREGTVLDVDLRAYGEVGPRPRGEARTNNGSDGLDFLFVNRNRDLAGTKDADDAGSG